MFDSNLMRGQRILVTGGGTGLGSDGRALPSRLAPTSRSAAGARRCETAAGRRASGFRAPRRHLRRRHPRRGGGRGDGRGAVRREGLTGLVNNAAGNFIAPTESLSPRAFDAIANIVFHGSFYASPRRSARRWVAEAKAGAWRPASLPQRDEHHHDLVDNGSPHVVPSAMSKAGIDVMTKSLAVEWARFGIRLNAVGPGEIPTEGMSKRLNPGEEPGARSRERNPMARPG